MSSSSKPGLMHQIKEKLFHGQKHVDADYEAAYAKFAHLNDSLHKLKASAHNYAASLYSVFLNSNNTAVEFGSLLEDSAIPNQYQTLVRELRTAHSQLNGDKQQILTNKLQEQVLQPIDAQLTSFQSINTRIAKRNELHENLEYYLTKVAGLNEEREARGGKGKLETSSQLEKHDRNQQKLDTARGEYQVFTSTLMADLHNCWSQRVAILGPAVAGFVEVEKQFVELYRNELLTVVNSGVLQQAPAGIVLAPSKASDFGTAVPAQALGPGDLTTVNSTAHPAVAPSSVVYPTMQQQQQPYQPQQTQQQDTSIASGLQQSHAMPPTEQATPIVSAYPAAFSNSSTTTNNGAVTNGPALVDQHGFEQVNESIPASQQQQPPSAVVQQPASLSSDPLAVQPSSTQSLGQMSQSHVVVGSDNPFATPPIAGQEQQATAPPGTVAPAVADQNPFEKRHAQEGQQYEQKPEMLV